MTTGRAPVGISVTTGRAPVGISVTTGRAPVGISVTTDLAPAAATAVMTGRAPVGISVTTGLAPAGISAMMDDRPRSGGYQRDDRPRADRQPDRAATDESGFEDRGVRASRNDDPVIPDEITADALDRQVRAELVSLARPVADTVARHLIVTGELLDEDPQLALAHAVAARRLASRIGVVREAVGIAAYHAGEWSTAISEIRTYHRMSGKQTHLAILADCERALGRPERAIDIFRAADRKGVNTRETVELLIVASGARRDMDQGEAAVAMLQIRELTSDEPWTARLRYAYADALQFVGRSDEAREWFVRTVDIDVDGETDAAERLLDIDGITIEGDDDEMDDPELALDLAHDEIDDRAESERDQAGPDIEPMPAGDDADVLVLSEDSVDAGDDEDLDDEDFDDEELDDEDLDDEELDDEDLDDEDLDDEDAYDDDDDDDDEDEDDWDEYVPVTTGNPTSAAPSRDPFATTAAPESAGRESADRESTDRADGSPDEDGPTGEEPRA